jgi:hypothetical protein
VCFCLVKDVELRSVANLLAASLKCIENKKEIEKERRVAQREKKKSCIEREKGKQ